MTLYSAHVNVDIEINGLPAPEAIRAGEEMPYKLMIEQSNAQTDFEGNINDAEEAKGTCYPELIYDAEKGCYRTDDFALFRMDNEGELDESCCEHELVLSTADGKELIRGSLYNFIKRNEKYIDVTKQEAYLPIEINFIETDVTIKLPAWYVEDIEPGWN